MQIGDSDTWVIVDQHDVVCGDMECSCIYSTEPDQEELEQIQNYYKGHSPELELRVKRVMLVELHP